ncbi:MAG: MCE family protein [Verrucomicrobia bacterium]|nr:MCE family protein [Verrucomicrobiota bacterium]
MNTQANLERRAGIFVFAGVVVTCALILHFGKVGDRFRGGYPVVVEFSNAGGLVPGAQVLYAGVLVGKVQAIVLNAKGNGVEAELNLFENTGIRKDARFTIKQSGLLGDQHIVAIPGSNTAPPLAAGDRVKGIDPFDFSDAANQAAEAVRKLNHAIDRLSAEVFEEETIANVKRSVKNLAELSDKLQSNSVRLDSILRNAQKGEGTLGKLLTDDQLFEELKRLVHNWRVHGLLHREKADERYPVPGQRVTPGPRSKD